MKEQGQTIFSAREIPQFLEAASVSWGSEQEQVRAGQEGELLHLEISFSEPEICKRKDLHHWAFVASRTGMIWVVTHVVEVGVGLNPRSTRWPLPVHRGGARQ